VKLIAFDSMNHLKTVMRAMPMRRQIEAYEAFKAAGGQIYVPSPEKVKFQQVSAGMRKWYKDKYGAEWFTVRNGWRSRTLP